MKRRTVRAAARAAKKIQRLKTAKHWRDNHAQFVAQKIGHNPNQKRNENHGETSL